MDKRRGQRRHYEDRWQPLTPAGVFPRIIVSLVSTPGGLFAFCYLCFRIAKNPAAMVLGPLDRRTLRTRCEACARRRIKCEGGSPCFYCTKKKFKCILQASKSGAGPVFVTHILTMTFLDESGGISTKTRDPILKLLTNITQNVPSRFVDHFFSAFLVRNDFACGALDLDTIIYEFQRSPSLFQASIAVGALDLRNSSTKPGERKEAELIALTSYRASINKFQDEIQATQIRHNSACLWTTLFLGLFELMYDASGDGWVKHFLYGTSKMLQIRGPEAHLGGKGRSFFLTVRVFEICRSLIFSEPSFLWEDGWSSLTHRMWDDPTTTDWHPKEVLLDLMMSCSSLSCLVSDALTPKSDAWQHPSDATLLDLATKGLAIRNSLSRWQTDFETWLGLHSNSRAEPRSVLATIYFHAISIYLSGIFDYRYQFQKIIMSPSPSPSPTLSQAAIDAHVEGILSRTEMSLKTTNIGGILYFFPLRVAGARAISVGQRTLILEMLGQISSRSFVVANAFVSDLKSLWGGRNSI